MNNRVQFSETYRRIYPHLGFGIAWVEAFDLESCSLRIAAMKNTQIEFIRQNVKSVMGTMEKYINFFASKDFKCPLPDQLQSILKKGSPNINTFVDTLIMSEMSTGILMGIQDAGKIAWPLILDITKSEEYFSGLKNNVVCSEGEIILKDAEGIVASYFQGPDNRTQVSNDTKQIVFYGFFAPGIENEHVQNALFRASSIFDPEVVRENIMLCFPDS